MTAPKVDDQYIGWLEVNGYPPPTVVTITRVDLDWPPYIGFDIEPADTEDNNMLHGCSCYWPLEDWLTLLDGLDPL